jgi:hypothetical protein
LLTVWYQHAKNKDDSGWYISFLHGGGMKSVKSIIVTAKIDGNTAKIPLDLGDQKVISDLFSNRMISRISYRDVLLLAAGKHLKIHYESSTKSNPIYTMALNDPGIKDGENSTQSANVILTELVEAARKLDKNCCEAPSIVPLSEYYHQIYTRCRATTRDSLLLKKSVPQNCHTILRNSPRIFSLIIDPLGTNYARLLNEIATAVKN